MRPTSRLGSLLSTYRGRPLTSRDILLLWLPGLAAVLLPLSLGAWRYAYANLNYGPVAAVHWSLPWLLLAAGGGFAFLVLALYRLLCAQQYVSVYQNGLRIRKFPFRWRNYTFDELSGISGLIIHERFMGLALRRQTRLFLHLASGRILRLPGPLQDAAGLCACLKELLNPRWQPQLQAEFAAGGWIYFGPLAVQARSVQLHRRWTTRSILWEDIKDLEVRAGWLRINLKAPGSSSASIRLPVEDIPNTELLLQISHSRVT